MADTLPVNPSGSIPHELQGLSNKDLGLPEPKADPIIEDWVLFYIPRKKRTVEFKFFKRKGTLREAINFTRGLCDKFGVRFIQVEPVWTDLEELMRKEQNFF